MDKKEFKKKFKQRLAEKFAMEVTDASSDELYQTLGSLMTSAYSQDWRETWKDYRENNQKQSFYFSIEFLPGKMLKSNLLNMGWLEPVEEGLDELGIQLNDLVEIEPDMALGNGGLGRLASCFMDSIASCGLPGNGNGIRYEYGLFKQRFVDNYQVELPDEWLQKGNLWEVRKESKAVDVQIGGNVYLKPDQYGNLSPVYEGGSKLRAVPYDTGMVGYQNKIVNTMRLWSLEIPPEEEDRYRS
ncbi:MAG: glycogen/starch/alpha-glucan phosphorylase, partial [Enterococcus viikkiensis]